MASNERFGSSVTTTSDMFCTWMNPANPALAINWATSGVCIAVFLSLAVYTQSALLNLFKSGVKLQTMDHPHYATAMLIFAFGWSLPPLINGGADVSMPCALYQVITQICSSGMVSLMVFRSLRFAQRLAQVQCRKLYLKDDIPNEPTEKKDDYNELVRKVAVSLRGDTPRTIALIVFSASVAIMILDPVGRAQLANQGTKCIARTSTYPLAAWIIYIVPYLFVIGRKFTIIDPYQIFYRLKFITGAALFAYVLTLINVQARVEENYGTSMHTLIENKYYFILQMGIWYPESFLPLYLTRRVLHTTSTESIAGSLADTLSDPVLLAKFEDHVISEWSPENLMFYMAVVLFQIRVQKALHRAASAVGCQLKIEADQVPENEEKKNPKSRSEKRTSSFLPALSRAHGGLSRARRELDFARRNALNIFERYIEEGSLRQINLESEQFEELKEFFSTPAFKRIYEAKKLKRGGFSGRFVEVSQHPASRSESRVRPDAGKSRHSTQSKIDPDAVPAQEPGHDFVEGSKNGKEVCADDEKPNVTSNPVLSISPKLEGKRNSTPGLQKSAPSGFGLLATGDQGSLLRSQNEFATKESSSARRRHIEKFCEAIADAGAHNVVSVVGAASTADGARTSRASTQGDGRRYSNASKSKQLINATSFLADPEDPSSATRFLEIPDNKLNAQQVCDAILLCANSFNNAKHAIFKLMERDSHRRFLRKLQKEATKAREAGGVV